jgi:hypothetical protein
VEEAFLTIHGKRGCLFRVERTEAQIISPRLLERDIMGHEINEIGSFSDLLNSLR